MKRAMKANILIKIKIKYDSIKPADLCSPATLPDMEVQHTNPKWSLRHEGID